MEVSFPKLGLNLNVDNVAFTIGGKEIYWYGMIIGLGFVLALTYAFFNVKRFNIKFDPLIDVVMVCFACAIIGARAYYVIFNYSSMFPAGEGLTAGEWFIRAIAIWDGGLAIYGGVIAAFLSAWFMCKRKKLNRLAVFDIAGIGFLIGQGIGRWGNFTNQEAFGSQTDSLFGMVSRNTGNVTVHPCFLYESVWCLVGVIALHFISKYWRKFDGQIFLMYLFWYGLGRVWIEGLRQDSLYIFGEIRVSQMVAGICVIVAGALLVIGFNRTKKRANLLPQSEDEIIDESSETPEDETENI